VCGEKVISKRNGHYHYASEAELGKAVEADTEKFAAKFDAKAFFKARKIDKKDFKAWYEQMSDEDKNFFSLLTSNLLVDAGVDAKEVGKRHALGRAEFNERLAQLLEGFKDITDEELAKLSIPAKRKEQYGKLIEEMQDALRYGDYEWRNFVLENRKNLSRLALDLTTASGAPQEILKQTGGTRMRETPGEEELADMPRFKADSEMVNEGPAWKRDMRQRGNTGGHRRRHARFAEEQPVGRSY
jgi:hypothetical protein